MAPSTDHVADHKTAVTGVGWGGTGKSGLNLATGTFRRGLDRA
jgi:hypothetical protein